jgi:D-alanyl-D-alanine carboxypeptidase
MSTRQPTNSRQLLLFTMGEPRYALNLAAVERVVQAVEVMPLPKAPPLVLGVINVQGQVIPVVDLGPCFGRPPREVAVNDQFILARTASRRIAVVAEAVMLAEAIAGSQEAFVVRMNATAARLGMTRTFFVNPNGLPASEQVTTARDMARLTVAVLRDFPTPASLWSMGEMRMGKRRMRSHNPLLRIYEGGDGIKTGFICDSGFNMVASATRDGRRIAAVVLGEVTGRERSARAANLLEHGFQTYAWTVAFGTDNLSTLPVAENAKGVASIRHAVKSWACGTARRPSRRALARRAKGKKGPGAARKAAQKQQPAAVSVKAKKD